jgi:hypothetical protein
MIWFRKIKYVPKPPRQEGETPLVNKTQIDEYFNLSIPYMSKEEDVKKNPLPYVIMRAEYFDEGLENQSTIMYYNDGVLADSYDEVQDIEKTVGDLLPDSFGDRSDDPNVVYIRNEVLQTDFEVIKVLEDFGDSEFPWSRKK